MKSQWPRSPGFARDYGWNTNVSWFYRKLRRWRKHIDTPSTWSYSPLILSELIHPGSQPPRLQGSYSPTPSCLLTPLYPRWTNPRCPPHILHDRSCPSIPRTPWYSPHRWQTVCWELMSAPRQAKAEQRLLPWTTDHRKGEFQGEVAHRFPRWTRITPKQESRATNAKGGGILPPSALLLDNQHTPRAHYWSRSTTTITQHLLATTKPSLRSMKRTPISLILSKEHRN